MGERDTVGTMIMLVAIVIPIILVLASFGTNIVAYAENRIAALLDISQEDGTSQGGEEPGKSGDNGGSTTKKIAGASAILAASLLLLTATLKGIGWSYQEARVASRSQAELNVIEMLSHGIPLSQKEIRRNLRRSSWIFWFLGDSIPHALSVLLLNHRIEVVGGLYRLSKPDSGPQSVAEATGEPNESGSATAPDEVRNGSAPGSEGNADASTI